MRFALAIALLLPRITAYAAIPLSASYTIVGSGTPYVNPPGGAVGWSTLSIVADGVTDNTTALNNLCTALGGCDGVKSIKCDTGSGKVLFTGNWNWQSNLQLYLVGCPMISTLSTNANVGVITQSDLTTALTNVYVDGLNLQKPARSGCNADKASCSCVSPNSPAANDYCGKMFYVYINNWTMTHWTALNYAGLGFFRGSNVEIGNGTATGGLPFTGSPGIRFFNNIPLQTSTGKPTIDGVVCNVWIHDNLVESGDGSFQVSPGPNGSGVWGDTQDSNGICYDNSNSTNTHQGPAILIGTGQDRPGNPPYLAHIQNIVFRNTTGKAGNQAIIMNPSDAGSIEENVTIDTATIDNSADTNASPAINPIAINTATMRNSTIKNVHIISPYLMCYRDDGGSGITFQNNTCDKTRAGGNASVYTRNSTNDTISSNTITSPDGGNGIQTGTNGNPTSSPTISNNTISNVQNGNNGIYLQNVDGATVTGNTITPAAAQTTARGITYVNNNGSTLGTTNTVAHNNDPSAITPSSQRVVFTCNGGTTNHAYSNTGASDSSCP